MSGSLFTLTIIWLFCIQSSRQLVCPTSCCECSLGGQEIECHGSQQFPQFCDTPTVFQKYELEDFNETKLYYDPKEVTMVEYLIIKHSRVALLSGLIKGQKSLKRIKLVNISVTNGWNWGPLFIQFTKLIDFHLEGCTHLGDKCDELVINGSADKNNMISFSVNKCGIKSIKTNMITKWIHLKMISLAHNCIHELDRDWFPSPLESLWSLDFSYNRIESIPNNYFSGMRSLRKLRLDNNCFITLHHYWFQHIWEGLNELWIDGNNIKCSSNLSWIPEKKRPTFFDDGTCLSEAKNETVYFHRLRPGDSYVS